MTNYLRRLVFAEDKLKTCWLRLTKCDSGRTLNPLMHVFLLITLVTSVAFLFFGHTEPVMTSVLYTNTVGIGQIAVNHFGVIGITTIALHVIGLLIRGRYGIQLMRFAMFGGFYIWLLACIIYIESGFLFQLLIGGIPNLLFWAWYAWQWRRRYTHQNQPEYEAFV